MLIRRLEMKYLATIIFLSLTLGQDVVLEVSNVEWSNITINIESSVDVYGFQFDIITDDTPFFVHTEEIVIYNEEGTDSIATSIIPILDGLATTYNFDIYGNTEGTVLGLSIAGDVIPAESNGILVTFPWDIEYNVEGSLSIVNAIVIGRNELGEVIELNVETGNSYSWVNISEDNMPRSFSLADNYPNPFNPTTEINYSIPTPCYVELTIFDVLGRKVNTLVKGFTRPNNYSIQWSGLTTDGEPVPSGIYYYQIEAGEYVSTKKMILLK
jgi:hypothetical protein